MSLLELRYATVILLMDYCRYNHYKTKEDIILFNSLVSVLEGVEKYRESTLHIKRIFCSIELRNEFT